MSPLRSVRVGVRLTVAFALVTLMLGVVFTVGYAGSKANHTALRRSADIAQAYAVVHDLTLSAGQVALAENSIAYDYASLSDPTADLQGLQDAQSAFADALTASRSAKLTSAERAKVSNAATAFDAYRSQAAQINAELKQNTGASRHQAAVGVAALSYGTIHTPLDQTGDLLLKRADAARRSADKTNSTSDRVQLTVVIVAVALAIGGALLLTRSITGPLARLQIALRKFADGDLTVTVDAAGRDEISDIADAARTAIAGTRDAVLAIDETSDRLSVAASQISSVSDAILASAADTGAQSEMLAASATELNATVVAASAAADELSSSIQEIATTTSAASQVGQAADEAAETSMQTVNELHAAGEEITSVTKLITGIAEQTNLLALNATIEAARAGVHGKGFAVVASEVKDLAGSTAHATEEIDTKVAGVRSSTSAMSAAMADVRERVQGVLDYQTTIASAIEEQNAVTSEIARIVGETATAASKIDVSAAATARSAATTSEAAHEARRSSEALTEDATRLEALAAHFKV